MTLNTKVYVQGSVDWDDFHGWVNRELLKAPDAAFTRTDHSLSNRMGQGLIAIFELSWSDVPQQYVSYILDQEDYRDEYDSDEEHQVAVAEFAAEFADEVERARVATEAIGDYYAEFSFDTGYGYKQDGRGCSDLHGTFLVKAYREYFEPRGVDFVWKNEFTGDLYKNLDGIETLLDGGAEATAWFENVLIPAVENNPAAFFSAAQSTPESDADKLMRLTMNRLRFN
jgi:hypothetical protein